MKSAHTKEPAMTLSRTLHELDGRSADGLAVTLLWDSGDDSVHVEVYDAASGERLRLTPPRDRALDAFHHPFAYAAHQGVDHTVGLRRREPAHA